jgi:hypothetical protein
MALHLPELVRSLMQAALGNIQTLHKPKTAHICLTGGDSDASCHVNDRELMKDPDVIFSGYRMPHPLEHKLELRVQTAENCKPEAALMKAIENLIKESTFMEEKFRVCVWYRTSTSLVFSFAAVVDRHLCKRPPFGDQCLSLC